MKPHELIKTFKKVIFWEIGTVNIENKYKKILNICKEKKIKIRKVREEVLKYAYSMLDQTYPKIPKPTAGFGAIVWARFFVWPDDDIYITGFDFYEGEKENTNTFKKHIPSKEKEVVTGWLKKKLINQL